MMKSYLTFDQLKPLVEANLKINKTAALMGEAGIGKSRFVEGLARTFKTKVFTLPVNQLADRSDLTGVRATQSENGTWRQEAFPHSIIMDAIEYAEAHPDEQPILFLDEFNRAPADITSSILSFETLRRVGTIDFPENLRFVVAGNDSGNVTSIDEASISRFAVYHVKPDLDTFMSIQTLNPFITDVLNQFPNDLMAEAFVEGSSSNNDNDDDDEDKESFEDIDSFFGSDENFTQVTRPRTISALSEWLTAMNIDKSGSDKEKESLATIMSDTTEGSQNQVSVLMAGIIAHVGHTSFAVNLYDKITTHYNSMLTATHTSNAPLLGNLRPEQDVVNKLSRANSVQDVEALIDSMSEESRQKTIVWLTEKANVTEINNNNAVTQFLANAPHKIKTLDQQSVKALMSMTTHDDKRSDASLTTLAKSGADSIKSYIATITHMIGIE